MTRGSRKLEDGMLSPEAADGDSQNVQAIDACDNFHSGDAMKPFSLLGQGRATMLGARDQNLLGSWIALLFLLLAFPSLSEARASLARFGLIHYADQI